MKFLFFCVSVFLFLFIAVVPAEAASVRRVGGYVTKKGTYVAPHLQTLPNKTKLDNFSTKGNINPFTGKKGTVNSLKVKKK